MLVLSRKADQSLILGEDITVTVLAIEGDRVKLGIRAPRSVSVLREEVYQQLRAANHGAADGTSRLSLKSVAAALRADRVDSAPA
jgi:carbon storage regulator